MRWLEILWQLQGDTSDGNQEWCDSGNEKEPSAHRFDSRQNVQVETEATFQRVGKLEKCLE